MLTKGINGIMPKQYLLYRAAKVLGCSVFELIREHMDGIYGNWIEWAMICEKADSLIEKAVDDDDEDD